MLYGSLCELKRDGCIREENIIEVDSSNCKLRQSVDLISNILLCF